MAHMTLGVGVERVVLFPTYGRLSRVWLMAEGLGLILKPTPYDLCIG